MTKRLHAHPSFEREYEASDSSAGLVRPKSEEDVLKILPTDIHDFLDSPSNYTKEKQNTIARKLIENGYAGIVADRLDQFRGLDASIAYLLVAKHRSISVLTNIEVFENIDINKLAEVLIENDFGYEIFSHDEVFLPYSLDTQIAIELIGTEFAQLLPLSFDRFKNIDYQLIAELLITDGKGLIVANELECFDNLNFDKIASLLLEHDEYVALAKQLKNFPSINHTELAQKLISTGNGDVLVKQISKFSGLDRYEIAMQVIHAGAGESVAYMISEFPQQDHDRIALELIRAGLGKTVAYNIDRFYNINRERVVQGLLDEEEYGILITLRNRFPNIDINLVISKILTSQSVENLSALSFYIDDIKDAKVLLSDLQQVELHIQSFSIVKELYSELCSEKWPEMDKAIEMFGEFVDVYLFKTISYLLNPSDDPLERESQAQLDYNLREFGVTKKYQEGLEQLKEIWQRVERVLINNEEDEALLDVLAKNPIARALLKKMSRYEESEWGTSSELVLRNIISKQYHLLKRNKNKTEIEKSQPLEIRTVESKNKTEQLFDEDVIQRYKRLCQQLVVAATALDNPFNKPQRPFTVLIEKLTEKLQQEQWGKDKQTGETYNRFERLQAIHHQQVIDGNTRAAEKTQQQLEQFLRLQNINLRNITDFEANFLDLVGNKRLHDEISTVLFAWALKFPPGGRNRTDLRVIIDKIYSLNSRADNPSLDDMSYIVNLIDHIINQEVFGHYFQTEEAKNLFADLTNTKSLQQAMEKVQGSQKITGVVPIEFIPTRGMLMELSGHLADACWAESYESIAEEFPNFTAVTIRQHPEGRHDRLVGAFMLIEGESYLGEPLLIIRGLNPIENFINKVDVEEFYEAAISYVKNVAKDMGRLPAIVIDSHVGGSATNRPVLFGYLTAKKRDLKNITVDVTNSSFNGYVIIDDTYLL